MMRTRTRARPLAPVATGLLVAGLLVATSVPAVAADREFVLNKGHVDGFEVTYDGDAEQLVLQVKDDTRIYDSGFVFRDPADVTFAYEDEQSIATLPPASGPWAFLGPYGGTEVWLGTQTGGDQTYAPWVGWSTERLHASLAGTGIEPAAGQPVSLDVEIDGPGDVFTYMTDTFGGPINRYVDTLAGGPNVIPVSANAHVHTNWVFTAEGDYELTVTPSLATVGDGTITGPAAVYHVRVGAGGGNGGDPGEPGDPEITLTIEGMAHHYHSGDTVTLTAVQDPDSGEDHYHWYTRADENDAWSTVPGALTDTYEFVAEAELDGLQIIARLFDHDHEVIAESAPVTLHIDDHDGHEPGEVTQDIVATLEAADGALVISVDPDDRVVNLPTFQLAADGASWETFGELRPVTVTDTRSDAPGWTASGQVGHFEADGASFSGSFLGWAPKVLSQADGQGVSPGDAVAPGFPSGDGLSVARTLASAGEGDGIGTAQVGADLELRIPTDTQPGVYEAALTFTAL